VDAIYLDQAGEPFVCIHCSRCVKYCPHDCLEMKEIAVETAAGEKEEEVQA
jgi:formate hydrogenlyase subunit 6/NADH:ubiquinone oxidoreductase subunit I